MTSLRDTLGMETIPDEPRIGLCLKMFQGIKRKPGPFTSDRSERTRHGGLGRFFRLPRSHVQRACALFHAYRGADPPYVHDEGLEQPPSDHHPSLLQSRRHRKCGTGYHVEHGSTHQNHRGGCPRTS